MILPVALGEPHGLPCPGFPAIAGTEMTVRAPQGCCALAYMSCPSFPCRPSSPVCVAELGKDTSALRSVAWSPAPRHRCEEGRAVSLCPGASPVPCAGLASQLASPPHATTGHESPPGNHIDGQPAWKALSTINYQGCRSQPRETPLPTRPGWYHQTDGQEQGCRGQEGSGSLRMAGRKGRWCGRRGQQPGASSEG